MKKVTIYTTSGNVFRFSNCEVQSDQHYIRITKDGETTSFPVTNVERAIFQRN